MIEFYAKDSAVPLLKRGAGKLLNLSGGGVVVVVVAPLMLRTHGRMGYKLRFSSGLGQAFRLVERRR